MHRIFCLIILLLTACLRLTAQVMPDPATYYPADPTVQGVMQEVTDAAQASGTDAGADSAAETVAAPVADQVPPSMLRSAWRSWWLSHPVPTKQEAPADYRRSPWVMGLLDSLRNAVTYDPGSLTDMRYLYDMRLPLMSSGSVPTEQDWGVGALVTRQEKVAARNEMPVTYADESYQQQLLNEQQRHLTRYNYASHDPRRFRYARRNFIVPTTDMHVLEQQNSWDTPLVADLDVNLGNASLESFGQDFFVTADRWHWKGDHTFTLQQTALTANWYNGGDNNMSLASDQKLTVTRYDEYSKVTFEGIFNLKLAGYYTKADTIHRMRVSDNEFNLNLKYGYRAWKKWYYSAQLYAKTPIFDFYNANSRTCKTTFLSPLEMNLALGVDYQYTSPNKRFTYSLLLAPLSYDMKYVKDPRINVTSYKIKEGESSVHNFGSTITTKFDWKMGPNASWSSRLYYFTTYHALKVEFENTLNFKISRYFTARIYFYPRFDDNTDVEVEGKEMMTIGFSYAW